MIIRKYLHESKNILILGFPFIINQLLYISISTIDTLMAGVDGNLTLAAVAQGAILWNVVHLILIGLIMPITPMFARLFACNDDKQMRDLFQQGIWLALLLIPLGLLLLLSIGKLMYLFGVDKAIIPLSTDYLSIMSFAIPFIMLYLPIRFLNEGIGNPKVIMFITALSAPINIIGNYIFINGLLGLPKMGASGIAIASVFSCVFVAIVGWFYILKCHHMKKRNLFQGGMQLPNFMIIFRIIKIGFPNSIAFLMESGMFATVVLLSGRLGVTVAAANQIALSYISIIFMVPLGISFVLTTRIGMAIGKNDKEKALIIGISGIIMVAIFMLFSVLIILFFGKSIANLYTDDEQVIKIAVGLLSLAAIFQIPDGIQVCSAGSLRALDETRSPMYYAILGYWFLAIPLAIILAFYYELGANGLWIGLLCGLSITAFLGSKKFIKLIHNIDFYNQ